MNKGWENLRNWKGTVYIHNGIQNKRIEKEEVEQYLAEGWQRGMLPRTPGQQEAIRQKTNETCLEKYGVLWPRNIPGVNEKIEQSCIEKYGAKSPVGSPIIQEKIKQTCLDKYGVEYQIGSTKIRNKIKETNLKNLGVEMPFASPIVLEKCKETWMEKYGVDNPRKAEEVKKKLLTPEIVNKIWETKRKNHTGKSSAPEEEYYNMLLDIYGPEDVLRNYNKEPRYPYACDFYIPSQDLFVELNFTWTHGEHPYNENSLEDQKKLQNWEEKAKTSTYYAAAIDVWTRRDVEKLSTARQNNLNYKRIYFKSKNEREKENYIYYDLWD